MNLSTNPLFTHGIDKLCTICHVILRDTDTSHSIFSTFEELESPMNVLQVLQSFSNFNFYNGAQMVCTTCYGKTIEVYKFIQMCNKAHDNIQHYLKDIEASKAIKDVERNVKLEEICIEPTRIIINGREFLEEMENEKISKIDEMEIKIEEIILQGMENEESSSNEEITTSHREIVNEFRLNTHIVADSGENPFTCLICQRVFAAPTSLRNHMMIHNGVKPHKCEQCDQRFTRASNLRTHMNIHNGLKPHKCEQCDRRFTDASNLRRHMMIHNRKLSYKCDQCEKRFAVRPTLIAHQLAHQRIHTANNYTICDKAFDTSSALKVHLRSHNIVKKRVGKRTNRRDCVKGGPAASGTSS